LKVAIKKPKNPKLALQHPTFVIVGMMRSGSNLLERYLDQLPDVRCHGELFNPAFIGFAAGIGKKPFAGYQREAPAKRNEDELAFLHAVDQACDRPIMGMRLFLDHSPVATSQLLHDPSVKKVLLSRNLLESYVSLAIARETDVWLTTREPTEPAKPVTIETNKFITYALRQALYFNDVLTVLNRSGQAFELIDYSELGDLKRLNDVARFVGSKSTLAALNDPVKRQNPGPTAAKVENYDKVLEDLRKRQLQRWFA